jgi:hypothetical protein
LKTSRELYAPQVAILGIVGVQNGPPILHASAARGFLSFCARNARSATDRPH